MRIRRHHEQDERDERDERELPAWQASKPQWGVVSIDAPKAVERRSPDRAA
jgi:hypothetical protein